MAEPLHDERERQQVEREVLDEERFELLQRISAMLEWPMTALGFVWLVLVILDLTRGLSPELLTLNYVIWGLFILQFLLELVIAPRKGVYLRHNWLTAIALVLPALRVVRVLRAFRVLRLLRGTRVVRVVSTANRGMRALGRVMGRRGAGYAIALTILVNLLGAAGIYAFEREASGGYFDGFATALWWTAMTLTSMGADYFPRTGEGRLLGLLLAVYGFAVFGYVTASIASIFVAQDANEEEGELAGARQVEALRTEMEALNRRLEALIEVEGRR